MTAEPLPTEPTAPAEPAAPAAEALPAEPLAAEALPAAPFVEPTPAAAPAVDPTPRRLRVVAATRRLLAAVLLLAIFGLGAAVGYSTFVVNEPAAPAVGGPALGDTPAPASVQELVAGLAANDPDALRSAVPPQPFQVLTTAMQGVQEVRSVETLATFADGPRTASHLILHVVQENGVPATFNLTVLTQDGAIVGVR